jgi:hypothetical protein
MLANTYRLNAKASYFELLLFIVHDTESFRIALWDSERTLPVIHIPTFLSRDEAASEAKAFAINYRYQEKGKATPEDFDYESLRLDWQEIVS